MATVIEGAVADPEQRDDTSAMPALLRVLNESEDHVSLEIGGMSEDHFALLPDFERLIIAAIEVERMIVACECSHASGQSPRVLRQAGRKMREYARVVDEGDSALDSKRHVYLQYLSGVTGRLSELINGYDRQLEVGNNPAKLDRLKEFPCREAGFTASQKATNVYALSAPHNTVAGVRNAIEELISNHLTHGNGLDPRKVCWVEAWNRNGTYTVRSRDQGWGYDPEAVDDSTLPENLLKPNGRGLLLMRTFMDDVKFSRRGRECTMTKHFQSNSNDAPAA
jgi:serine/threonine-protein kinase RsbW